MEESPNKQSVAAEPLKTEVLTTHSDHSRAFGISVRGWIAIIVVLTVCAMSVGKIEVKEPLYTLAGLVVGFYFGQNPNAPKR